MKILKLSLLILVSLFFCSCSNESLLVSLEIKTIDVKEVKEKNIEDRTRSIKTKYPFMAYELNTNDSSMISAGIMVKIIAQELPHFTDISLVKPQRLLAYSPNVRFLLELPDGKRVWGALPEASIGLKAYCFETNDTVMITGVTRYSKAVRKSKYKYMYSAGSKKYTFEELGWGLRNQIYYYHHHEIVTPSTSKWINKFMKLVNKNPLYKILDGSDGFYQYPRFDFMNTRWMSTGWHIFFMIMSLIIVTLLYCILISMIIETFFSYIMRNTIFKIKKLKNQSVLALSRLLLLIFVCSIIYFLGMIDLFITIYFVIAWRNLRTEVEMERCPYCHSVGKLRILEKSDIRNSVSDSLEYSTDVKVGEKYSEYTRSDGTRVHLTTNLMEKQKFRRRDYYKQWKENYCCTECKRLISYNKSETHSQDNRVG